MVNIVQYWLRRHTSAEWIGRNPVLNDGEVGLETDTGIFRIGDGVTPWNDLNALPGSGGSGGAIFVYNVNDYEPLPLPTDDNLFALQAALDAAHAAGGGVVQLPRGRQFGWEGTLVIPPDVRLCGNGPTALGLIALDATSKIQVGEWVGDNAYVGGLEDLFIDGNGTGHPDGLVTHQSVFAHMDRCFVVDAAGYGLVLDAAQNASITRTRVTGCSAGLVIKNGAGGYNFNGSHFTDNDKDLLIFDGDSSANNAYPFGSAHLNFWGGIFENYVNGDYIADIQCGGAVVFWGTGFSVNGAITMSGAAAVRINNAGFPGIGTYVTFNSCTFNGGDNNYAGVKIEGNQTVTFAGTNYIQQHDPGFCVVTSGSPLIRNYGTFDHGSAVTAEFAATGAGSLVSLFTPQHSNVNAKLPASRPTVISSSLDTDAGHRHWRDVYGKMNWNDGTDFGANQTLEYDATNDHLLITDLMVNGRIGLVPGSWVYANGAVTLDTKASAFHRIILTGTGSITSLTLSNPFDGAEVTLAIADDTGAHVITGLTGAANINWFGNPPITPYPGDWLVIRLVYIEATAEWAVISRSDKDIRPINAQVGTTYTPVLADRDKWVTLTNASPIALTIPLNVFPVGAMLEFSVEGVGEVTVAPVSGSVTLNSRGNRLKSNGQFAVFGAKQTALNVWNLYGDLKV